MDQSQNYQSIIKSDNYYNCIYDHGNCTNHSCQYYNTQCVGRDVCNLYEIKNTLPNRSKGNIKRVSTLKKILVSKIIPGIIIALVSGKISHYFALKEIKYSYDFSITNYENGEYTTEELLEKASNYFVTENYIDAINIYMLDEMKTNSIALNNLAYMYENGIFVKKDIYLATELYFKAANLNNAQAIDNYVIINLQNLKDIDNLMYALEFGYINGSNIVYNFLDIITYDGGKELIDFFNMGRFERMDILLQIMNWEKINYEEYKMLQNYENHGYYSFIDKEEISGSKSLFIGYDCTPNYDNGFYNIEKLETEVEFISAVYYRRVFVNVSKFNTSFIY